jgi:3-oxoacyl-[acyl-carrier-protein] synthase II
MERRVVVTGAGVVSPAGCSPAELHAALCAGSSGLKPIELFERNGTGPGRAGEVRPFEPRQWLGERNLRPVDRTARLLLAAATSALAESGWTEEARRGAEVGLVLGTRFCSVHTIVEFDRRGQELGPSHVSPMDFANSVINAAAGQAAIWHGLRGVNSTISAGEASSAMAIGTASGLIRTGRTTAVLAGGVEELCQESFLGYALAGQSAGGGANGNGERPVPFDARRNGFAPAEGAALLVLEEAGSAAARGARVLAEIAGHGSAFDASPDGTGMADAVARAIRVALADAGLEPDEVDALSSGANGSVRGDRAEALGVAAALGARAAGVPVTAIKSMLGEGMGASSALQAVAALGTLADGRLPGIAGLESTEEGFPLPGASASTCRLARRLERGERGGGPWNILITAAGSGGHSCALVLRAPGAKEEPS